MGQRKHLRSRLTASAFAVLCLTALTSTGCTVGDKAEPTAVPPTISPTTPAPTGTEGVEPDDFERVDAQIGHMVDERATWQAPTSLVVNRSERIGLVIGDSEQLRNQIADLVEKAKPRKPVPVKVGPKMRVALWADTGDAQVKPSEAVDQSTGSQIAMLWTWLVRPLRASDGMIFTAHVEVHSDASTFTTDVPLRIRVERTVSHMLGQVFTHWATLSAIAAALGSGVGWLWKRRRGKQSAVADGSGDGSPVPEQPYAS